MYLNRFPDESKLASFFGKVPATRDSSSIKRRSCISKMEREPQDAPIITIDTIKLRNKAVWYYFKHQKNRTGFGKLAHVLTMRKLVRMMYFLLKKEWKYNDPALTEIKISKLDE